MKPMLAVMGTQDVLDRKDYLFEPKLDGIRALCFKKTKLKFMTRNEIDVTAKYPEFDFFDDIRAKECILDGEIVVYDEEGHPSFELWMERDKGNEELSATYVVFDILYLNGKSLLNIPLYQRRKILEQTVREGPHLQTMFCTKNGRALWDMIKKESIEGVVAKKNDSSYEMGVRSDAWLKVKSVKELDCVILGYTTEKRKLTSLALGAYIDGVLTFVGKVGTGFDEKTLTYLREKLDAIMVEQGVVEMEKDVIAVEPVLVVEVAYQNVTKNNKLRAARFVRLREDKSPQECVLR